MTMISELANGITFALDNPGHGTQRELLCCAVLDMLPGHVLRDRRPDPAWYATQAQAAIRNVMPEDGTCALLDTTTVVNAFSILDANTQIASLPPGAIFDLATFVSACVFEDNVVFLANKRVSSADVSALLAGLPCRTLPWGDVSDFGLIVENTWGQAERFTPALFRHPKWRDRFIDHWSSLAGTPLAPEAASWPANYRAYFSSIDSLALEHAIISNDPNDGHLTVVLDLMKGFVTESSVRAVFYSVLGNALNASYYASSFRSRLRELVYEEAEQSVVADTMALGKHLNGWFQADIAKDTLVATEVQMPFALSAALAGAGSCADVCANVMKLRELAKPLRDKRHELTLAWKNKDQAAVNALSHAVTAGARALADSQYSAGNGLVARFVLSHGGARPAFGALGQLLIAFSGLPDDVKAVLRQRLVRPELWAVTQLSAQARRVIDCLEPLYGLMKAKGLRLSRTDKKGQLTMLSRLAA